jgi:outer membrane protein TolC
MLMRNKVLIMIVVCFLLHSYAMADELLSIELEGRILTLGDFIQLGTQKDSEFEEILIDRMILAYQKNLRLPAGDIVLSVKEQYHLFLEADKERAETSVSLSKLFPMTGTQLKAVYNSTPVSAVLRNEATAGIEITQSIAENAFGHSTRLLDQIIGVEVAIAQHQVTEAYEDYLSFIILAYFEWFEDYENLKIGLSSYTANLKLLTNIRERQKSSIALPIDVNKVELQVMDKRESLIGFYDEFRRQTNLIRRIIRTDRAEDILPQLFEYVQSLKSQFDDEYSVFEAESRTYQVLELLEKNSSLQVDRDAHDLLPSIDLFVGYEVEGTDFNLEDNDRLFYAGAQFDWPFPDTVEKAEYEVSRLDYKKTLHNITNTHYRLYVQLRNLYEEIQREIKLTHIAETKISLANDVLEDETENYKFGKVTLNDYIQAVNAFDNTRFNHVLHSVRLKKLVLEWKRITDTLITTDSIQSNHP